MESSVEAEEWRPVVGYEGHYEVSSLGRVRTLMRKGVRLETPYIRKQVLYPSGYLFVGLSKDGEKPKAIKVSRLVAKAFLPNPDNLPQVNHKDENKTNNRLDNLEWCDAKYNVNYGTGRARLIAQLINHPAKSRPVNQYSLDGTLIATYPSFMEAYRATGVARRGMLCCCVGGRMKRRESDGTMYFKRIFTAGGFRWQYADNKQLEGESKP